MKISTLLGYALLCLTILWNDASFGMAALGNKQRLVAQEQLQTTQEKKPVGKKEQDEKTTAGGSPSAAKVKPKSETCKAISKADLARLGISGSDPALWVAETAQYEDCYKIFSLQKDVEPATLSKTESATKDLAQAWINFFESFAKNGCSEEYSNKAIQKIRAFEDFLINVRSKDLKGESILNKLYEYQFEYANAKEESDTGNFPKYKTDVAASNAQQLYIFGASFIKDYIKKNPMLAASLKFDKEAVLNFDVGQKAVAVNAGISMDVNIQERRMGDLQRAMTQKSSPTTQEASEFRTQLTLRETSINELENEPSLTSEDKNALDVLRRTIAGLREKLAEVK